MNVKLVSICDKTFLLVPSSMTESEFSQVRRAKLELGIESVSEVDKRRVKELAYQNIVLLSLSVLRL